MSNSNVTDPIFLSCHTESAFSFIPTQDVEPFKFSLISGVPPANGTLNTLLDGVAITEALLADGETFSLQTEGISILQVEPGAILSPGTPVSAANTGTGNARPGVPGTDQIVGTCLDTTDGSGTAQVPHYVRVLLNL